MSAVLPFRLFQTAAMRCAGNKQLQAKLIKAVRSDLDQGGNGHKPIYELRRAASTDPKGAA